MPGGNRRPHGESTVYQRGRKGGRGGGWVAIADLGYLPGGRRDRREFTGPTKDEAINRRAAFLHRRADGFTIPRGRQPYVSEWVLHWLHGPAKRKVADTTWHGSYRQKVEHHIVPHFDRIPLNELTEEDVEDWHRALEATVSARTGRPLSAKTIQHCHRILSTAIKMAVVRGKLPRNPVANVPPPSVRPVEQQLPSVVEVRAILARCGTWPGGARWVLAIATGLRQGEALALQWEDVKLTAPASVTVRRSAARVAGERIVKEPKSRSSRRTVPLAAVAVTALRAHRESQPVRAIGDAEDLVFRSVTGKPVHPKVDYGNWHALLDDLGIRHYRVHDCRHGFATMLLEQGADPRVVQELLGHSTGALLDVYQHVRQVSHDQARGMIDDALGGG